MDVWIDGLIDRFLWICVIYVYFFVMFCKSEPPSMDRMDVKLQEGPIFCKTMVKWHEMTELWYPDTRAPHLPASSKWPFDSQNWSHLSHEQVTYGSKRGGFGEPGDFSHFFYRFFPNRLLAFLILFLVEDSEVDIHWWVVSPKVDPWSRSIPQWMMEKTLGRKRWERRWSVVS